MDKAYGIIQGGMDMEVIYTKWHNNYDELTIGQKYKASLYKKMVAYRNRIATIIVSRRMLYCSFIKEQLAKANCSGNGIWFEMGCLQY